MLMKCIAAGLVGVTLAACAGLETATIANDDADKLATGFRYYDTSPFLLIYTDSKGGLISQIHYLPDTTKKRSIKPFAYLASAEGVLKFQDGKLTQAKASIDETVVPMQLISSLEKIALADIKAANGGKESIPSPYLFRIVHTASGWSLAGSGQAIDMQGQPVIINYQP